MKAPVIVRTGPVVLRVRVRSVLGVSALVVACAAVAALGIVTGDYPDTVAGSFAALIGSTGDPLASVFVVDVRLPRIVAAAAVGAALGVSGAAFQVVSGNPLGSPDITGFTAGSATGALVAIIVFGGSPTSVASGAVAGGVAVAVLIYLLARRGGVTGHRIVLVGVGVGAALAAVNSMLLVRASLGAAQTAAQWLAGSLNGMTWDRVWPTLLGVGVLIPAAFALSRSLSLLSMGDDIATGLGGRPARTRVAAIAVAVGLVSIACAAAGPVAFVALAAPQLAARLVRTTGAGLTGAAAMGALLVLAGDRIAQDLLSPVQLPVGVVTGSVGGLYLAWLLARQRRVRR
ncbi:FecCD family ABC transporter permease [Lentzea sp. NPDC058436]|uniref:FecCD family ABC transporter permease n=1 Tax=Lentzea sp. NPDC058436 TaxID=3346499 RepID=UPI003647B0DE